GTNQGGGGEDRPQNLSRSQRQHCERSNENGCSWQVNIPRQSSSQIGRRHRTVCSICKISTQRFAWFVGVCVLKQASGVIIDSFEIQHQIGLGALQRNGQ